MMRNSIQVTLVGVKNRGTYYVQGDGSNFEISCVALRSFFVADLRCLIRSEELLASSRNPQPPNTDLGDRQTLIRRSI
jgi:hypothetical protein